MEESACPVRCVVEGPDGPSVLIGGHDAAELAPLLVRALRQRENTDRVQVSRSLWLRAVEIEEVAAHHRRNRVSTTTDGEFPSGRVGTMATDKWVSTSEVTLITGWSRQNVTQRCRRGCAGWSVERARPPPACSWSRTRQSSELWI